MRCSQVVTADSPRTLVDQYTAVVRGEMAPEDMAGWLSNAYHSVDEYLRRVHVSPNGPPFARYAFLQGVVAVEAGFPVPCEIARQGAVEPSTLPDGPAAVTTHFGRYEDLTMAYEAVHRWLDDHGLVPAGPHWEIYYTDPVAEPDPSRWRTDVVVPYRLA
ncbi:MAG TPA: GyrI-like domain-containing protein [Jiangellales bacterium]|nr:GyrI-like domain-containing protein [Jiangellales bacterium]